MKTDNRRAKRSEELTDKIEKALREVTLNAESEAELESARIAEEIFSASTTEHRENLAERLGISQKFLAETPGDGR